MIPIGRPPSSKTQKQNHPWKTIIKELIFQNSIYGFLSNFGGTRRVMTQISVTYSQKKENYGGKIICKNENEPSPPSLKTRFQIRFKLGRLGTNDSSLRCI